MSGSVKLFPGVEFIDQGADEQPNEDIIELLERMLERAEAGELQAVGVVAVLANNINLHEYSLGNGPHRHTLIAGVAELQFGMLYDLHISKEAPEEEDQAD